MKFEVGKRYKKDVGYKHNNKPVLWVCVAIHKTIPIFCLEEPELSDIYPFTSVGNLGWVEYKEPVVHKATLVWVKYPNGAVIPFTETSRNNYAVGCAYTSGWVVAVQNISYTEGQS